MNSLSQIQQLTIPINYSGSVNMYVIEGTQGYYLIDAGIASDEARILINQQVRGPVAGILLTHAHMDHLGLAGEISREQGCPVYLYAEEHHRLQDSKRQSEKTGQLLALGGVPAELLDEAAEAFQRLRENNAAKLAGAAIIELSSEDKFRTVLGDLQVIHTPGHTMGHCCFYLAEEKQLFCGDHILAGVSPNPILEIGKNGQRRPALLEYLKSLDKIKALSAKRFYPGHGQPFENLDEILGPFYEHHLKREQRILASLSQKPQTPFQIAEKLYSGVRGLNIFLALSRVWGYLDLIDLEGKITVQIEGNTAFYCLR